MGNYMRIKNETPYTVSYCYYYDVSSGTLQGGDVLEPGKVRDNTQLVFPSTVHVKYGPHKSEACRRDSHLTTTYNPYYNPKFFVRVAGAMAQNLQLLYEGTRSVICPNPGKLEEKATREMNQLKFIEAEKARKQREEARRREEELERERAIQNKMNEENIALEEMLSETSEQLKFQQTGVEKHYPDSEVLQFFMQEDIVSADTDEEVKAVEEEFNQLLNANSIQEDSSMASCDIRKRMQTLQRQFLMQYFREKNLPVWSLRSLDKALSCQRLSLTETLSFLQAVIQVTVRQEALDIKKTLSYIKTLDDKSRCIILILDVLYRANKTLAWKLSRAIFSELSSTSQEYLCQILFNGIWNLMQAVLFSLQALEATTSQEIVDCILQKVLTYQLHDAVAKHLLTLDEPLDFLQKYIKKEKDKIAPMILNEMKTNKFPTKVMSVLEPVLLKMGRRLPEYWSNIKQINLTDDLKNEGINIVKSLDFENPDEEKLVKVLTGLSIAVQDVTTIVTDAGETLEGYFPRLTQLAALLVLLFSRTEENHGCLLEIATGEGKSTVVAMLAIIHALRGKKVDIITSNPVLARRDKEDWNGLYKMFGLTCSVIPPPGLEECTSSPQRENAIKEAYKADIVYGTVSNFTADILRQEFEKNKTRGDRPFDVAIVDEVDYMTLDSGVQVTYLSHETTGMRHLEQMLAAIWAKVCMCQQIEIAQTGERIWITGAQYFHKAAATAVMGSETSEHFSPQDILMPGLQLGFFTEEDIEKLASKVNEPSSEESKAEDSKIKEIMNKLEPSQQRDLLTVFEEVLDTTVQFECYKVENGRAVSCDTNSTVTHDNKIRMLLLEHGLACTMISEEDLIKATVDQITSQLKFSHDYKPPEKEEKTDKNFLVLPGYLEEYTNNRLKVFVDNALKATLMMQDREYMIESAVDRGKDKTETREYDAIIPVDFRATGILEKNKRWGDGLQQCLEMKHQLAITPLTNVTNFMSNFHFFQRYTKGTGLFGVSGTLGDEAEIEFLRKHFKTSCFTIPKHRYTKKVELPPIQVEGERDVWIKAICDCVKERTREKQWVKGQAVLIVCEDVRTADELQKKLLEYEAVPSSDKITLYTRSDKHNVEGKTFNPGDVIIATNLGGRGTDFQVHKDVNESGGLCVILTHFPKNRRTEKQIFGRTARKGNPGMVQMVLNYEDLEPSYQGQPVEIMRQLRADYEKKCIADMEKEELQEAGMREELFKVFCQFLTEFDKNYDKLEKMDIFTSTDKHLLDTNFGCYKDKMDYQTALNALKETWALWLTLHEKDIDNHSNLDELKEKLCEVLMTKKDELLAGKSNNYHDFVKLAMDRMYLHTGDKDKDYGALTYWEKAESTDPVYCAISRYNRAYITVNLRNNGYIQKAIDLLNDTQKTLNIFISEQTNTIVACQISSIAQFEPHSKKEPNFTKQMQTRMSLFKSFLDFNKKSVQKLTELQEAGDEAITKDMAVFSLSDRHDYITTEELTTLYKMGLSFVFEVEKKPQFCIDALVCAILGALQVLAGVLVCAFSFGTATQLGMAVIMEGVADLINGVVGMATESFDWAEWACAKSLSIGLSIATAGFSTVASISKTVYQTTKSLLTGAKTFASLADDIIQQGKVIFTSVKDSVQSAISSTTKESLSQSLKELTVSTTVRTNLIQAAKFAGQETLKLAATTALAFAVDEGLQVTFKYILLSNLRQTVENAINENATIKKYLIKFIIIQSAPENAFSKIKLKGTASRFVYRVSKGQSSSRGTQADQTSERSNYFGTDKEGMKSLIEEVCRSAVTEVTNDFETFGNIMTTLEPMAETALSVMKEANLSGTKLKRIEFAKQLVSNLDNLLQIVNAIPTKHIIDDRVVPFFVKQIDAIPNADAYKENEQGESEEVVKLQKELLEAIVEELLKAFSEVLAGRLTAQVSILVNRELGEYVTNKISTIVGSNKTERFFADQTHRQEMKKLKPGEGKQTLTEDEQKDFDDYVKKLQDETRPATELDLNILTKSDLLQGKTVKILVVDENQKMLSTETYPGNDSSAETITLQLTKVREQTGSKSFIGKVQDRLKEEESAYSGKFSLVQSDGTVISIESDDPTSLYNNLAAATGATTEQEIKEQAQQLKSLVNKEISDKTDHYQELIKMQMDYEKIYETAGKYTIQGSGTTETVSQDQSSEGQVGPRSRRSRRDVSLQTTSNPIENKITECLEKVSPMELDVILASGLGMVSTASSLPSESYQFNVVQNPVPPMSVLELALQQAPPEFGVTLEELGKKGLSMTVLSDHYWSALSNGWESSSSTIRSHIANEIVNGNWEKALKLSMISTHPKASEDLREDAGLESVASWRWDPEAMSEQGMNAYYQMGFYYMVTKYRELNIVDEELLFTLLFWIEAEEYMNKDTSEYQEILEIIKASADKTESSMTTEEDAAH